MKFISICAFLLLTSTALGSTLLVNPDGSGQFPTIQAAVDSANPGDIIELGDGTFSGPGNCAILVSRVNIALQSASNNPANCIIDCGMRQGIVFQYGPTSHIKGISFTNGGTGGLIEGHNNNIEIWNCNFYGNNNSSIVSMFGYMGGPVLYVYDSILRDNVCTSIGSFLEAGSYWLNCVFENNSGAIILQRGCGSNIWNSYIINNSSPSYLFSGGRAAFSGLGLWVENCTIFENSANVFLEGATDFTLFDGKFRNNIIASNYYNQTFNPELPGDDFLAFNYLTVENNCIFKNGLLNDWWQFQGYAGNMSVDPLCCDPYSGDFGLCMNSPCLNINNGGLGLIGASSSTCGACGPVPIETRSFGSVKALFR